MPRGSIMGTSLALRYTVTTKVTENDAYCIDTEAFKKLGLYNHSICLI